MANRTKYEPAKKLRAKFIILIVLLFIVLHALFLAMGHYTPAYRYHILMAGNAIMAGLSLITFTLVTHQLGGRPAAFLRAVYGSSLLKLMVCIIAIVAYALAAAPNIHKPTIFVLMAIYAIYTTAETISLSKTVRTFKT